MSLPPAVETWALAQEVPFTVEDVVAAVPGTTAAVADLLAVHPAIARVGARFHTPRILAKRASFVVRLTTAERRTRYFLAGHRLLPFRTLDRAHDDMTLLLPDGTRLRARRCYIAAKEAIATMSLLDPPAEPLAEARKGKVIVPVFLLPWTLLRKHAFRQEWELRCVDFDGGVYSVAAHVPRTAKRFREAQDHLCAALAAVVKAPPPGPASAARQLLHAVAACLDRGVTPPIGPIGPMLTSDLPIERFSGRTAFVAPIPKGPAPWAAAIRRIEAAARDDGAMGEEARVSWRVVESDGAISVSPYVQKARPAGSWTRGTPVSIERVLEGGEPAATSTDEMAVRCGMVARSGQRFDPYATLDRLVGHSLVFREEGPVRVERGEASLRLSKEEDGGYALTVAVGPLVTGEGVSCTLGARGIVLFDRRAGVAAVAPARRPVLEMARVVAANRPRFPAEARDELLARLPAIEAVAAVELPEDLAGDEVVASDAVVVRLAVEVPSGLSATLRVRPLAGGPALVPGASPSRVSAVADGRRVCTRRDAKAEGARARKATESLALGAFPESPAWTWRIERDEDALDLLVRLEGAGLAVEWVDDSRRWRLTRKATPKDLRVAVRDAQDWFEIEGDLDVDGARVPLAALLQAIRRGGRYVPVQGGTWARLSQLFRDRLRDVVDLVQSTQGKLSISPAAAPLVRSALEEATVSASPAWERLAARYQHAMSIAPDPPLTFTATLRPYQLEGFRWMSRLAAWGVGGVLADDMGLGKTVQVLAVLAARLTEGPALVIAPTSVSANWVEEARRFAPTLRPVLYRESDRAEGDVRAGDMVVVSYAMALRDIERLAAVRWGTLVLDEAQAVKNSQTKTAQAVRRIEAAWRVALTGTPIENHLGDLWSLFRAVLPGLLGSWERFRERFAAPTSKLALPVERDRDASRLEALARVVRPFILRRRKEEVLRELPARTEVRLDAELSSEERAIYERARVEALARLATAVPGQDPRFEVLSALTRLRQLACHPRLVDADGPKGSAKLHVFLDTVEELREEGHRALVFSQFTSLLAIVREALDARGVRYLYLDGSTPAAKRDEAVRAFQGGEGDLFLISLKAGGTGLNLTGADYVIHLDPWWNPAVMDQATDRTHRIGQTRAVTVYRIVSTGTIEEKILTLHASKRALVEGVLAGTDQAARLSTEDLIALLREA